MNKSSVYLLDISKNEIYVVHKPCRHVVLVRLFFVDAYYPILT
jgi:hypothetical protein